jgi:hypothetical protein
MLIDGQPPPKVHIGGESTFEVANIKKRATGVVEVHRWKQATPVCDGSANLMVN